MAATVKQQNRDIATLTNEKVCLLQNLEEKDKQIVSFEEDKKLTEIKYLKTIKVLMAVLLISVTLYSNSLFWIG